MGHSVLPHQHHTTDSSAIPSTTNTTTDNFIDFLKLMFGQDIGEGHLEHYDMCDDQVLDHQITIDLNIQPLLTSSWKLNLLPTPTQNIRLPKDDAPPEGVHFRVHPLRGPPIIS